MPTPKDPSPTAYHSLWVHIDAARNVRRWYRIVWQATLFGGIDVVCEWGRIGNAGGQIHVTPCASAESAVRFTLEAVRRRKRHGYRQVSGAAADDLEITGGAYRVR